MAATPAASIAIAFTNSSRRMSEVENAPSRERHGSGPYAHEDGQHAFVERIERLLAGETRAWRAAHKKK